MFHGLIDFLFPAQCAGCDAIGDGLCEGCVPRAAPPVVRALDSLRVVALGSYEGPLRRAVLAVKDGRRDVAGALGERMRALISPRTLLVPVPTTIERRRARGFDGVEAIARVAAREGNASMVRALELVGRDAQRGRDRARRLAACGRFRCTTTVLEGCDVALLDDVCTTGSTLEDCAAALRAAGAHVTQAFVVAIANGAG